ncbi:MAG: coproporphyrinogen dehydrogenase HemZ, partial [Selenomonas massiliensis]
MKIRSLTINSRAEVIVKIVREVLTLFKVEIVGRAGEADYAQLSVVNRQSGCEPPSVMTEVFL